MKIPALCLSLLTLFVCSVSSAAGPIRVGVIDTGLDLNDDRFRDVLCHFGHKDFTRKGISDHAGHGTHVAGIIKEWAGAAQYCMVIIKYSEGMEGNRTLWYDAMQYAVNLDLDYVNISSYGTGPVEQERTLLMNAPRNMKWVTVAGNEGKNQLVYPCGYALPRVRCVGALSTDGVNRASFSNYGLWVTDWMEGQDILSTIPNGLMGRMSGTSMAAPRLTGALISGKLK